MSALTTKQIDSRLLPLIGDQPDPLRDILEKLPVFKAEWEPDKSVVGS